MRISDWSSDVCSSDLRDPAGAAPSGQGLQPEQRIEELHRHSAQLQHQLGADAEPAGSRRGGEGGRAARLWRSRWRAVAALQFRSVRVRPRSEEHTSELQSLMRISFAVFYSKKKSN